MATLQCIKTVQYMKLRLLVRLFKISLCVCAHVSRCSVRSRISAAIHSSNSSRNKSLCVPDSLLNPESLSRLCADISPSGSQHDVIGSYQVASASIPNCFLMDLETILHWRARSNLMEMKCKQVS